MSKLTLTTTTALLAQAVKSARAGDIDTVEHLFDIVNTWVISPEAKYEIDCILADCCAIADGRDQA